MFFSWNYSQPGTYNVKVIADRNNLIPEINEVNNQQGLTLNIMPAKAAKIKHG